MNEGEVAEAHIDAFTRVWQEAADMPYGPARVAAHLLPDGTLDVPALRAADTDAERLNTALIRSALTAVFAVDGGWRP